MTDMMIDNFYHTIKNAQVLVIVLVFIIMKLNFCDNRVAAARREKQWRSGNNKEHPKKSFTFWKK